MLRSDPRIHYKMYKAKKNMVYAALFSFAVLGGLGLSQNAKADTVENNNVTPAVQTAAVTSQSTATPQSSAADVNAVNSAPTAQPVSAQPVVNNQTNSASNVADQAQTTTLNVQSVQPARNLAATRRARLYMQSFVQVNQQSAVSNVQATYTCNNSGDVQSPGWAWAVDTQYEFDLDTTKAQLNTPMTLGHFTQSSDTKGNMALRTSQTSKPVYYHDQQIGNIYYDPNADWNKAIDVPVLFTMTAKPNAVGTIHLIGEYPGDIFINENEAPNFRSIPLSHNTISFVTNNKQVTTSLSFTVKQTTYGRWDQQDLNYIKAQARSDAQNSYFRTAQISSAGDFSFTINTVWPELDPDSVAEALHSDNVTTSVKTVNRTYEAAGRISLANGGTLLNNTDALVLGYTGGAIGTDSQGHYLINDNPSLSYAARNVEMIKANDGATLSQLKSMLDPTKNCILWSQQNDGSLLYLSNLTPSFFQSQETDASRLKDTNAFQTTNADSDPDKAAQISSDAIKNVFHSHPKYDSVWVWTKLADPTVKTTVKVDNLDLNTGSVINSTSKDFIPNTYMAHGQAAVKLHVINATNGTELNQSSKLINEARYGK